MKGRARPHAASTAIGQVTLPISAPLRKRKEVDKAEAHHALKKTSCSICRGCELRPLITGSTTMIMRRGASPDSRVEATP